MSITGSSDWAAVVKRLRATFDSGVTRPYEWRAAQLGAVAARLKERSGELVAALVADLRRGEIDAGLFDIVPTKGEVAHARKHLRAWMRPHRVATPMMARPGKAWYRYEPLGVTLIIAPWNYPVHLALTPLVAALAA